MSGSASNCVIGWQNAVLTGTLTASAEEASLPVANLRSPHGARSEAWQTPAGVLSAWVQIVQPSAIVWNAFMFARTNFTGAATIRVRLGAPGTITSSPVFDSGTLSSLTSQPITVSNTALACRIDVSDPTNPDGFLNMPLLYAGPAWQLRANISPASTQIMEDGLRTTVTRGGQQHIEESWTRRGWVLDLPFIYSSDGEQRMLDIEATARRGQNILVIPRPATQAQRDAVFGQATGFRPLGFNRVSAYRAGGFTISERL